MNKQIVRLGAGFVIVLGLAYIGHQVFQSPGADAPAGAAPGAAATATAGGASTAAGKSAFAVYPDRATEAALGLDYPTFSGDFAHQVTVTPLPPGTPGATQLRILPGEAHGLDIGLNEKRCGAPVQVAIYRINDKKAIATAALDSNNPIMNVAFDDGKVPALLVEMRMDEKAQNNYWCGVSVRWVQQQAPAAGEPAAAAPAPVAAK